MRPSAPLLGVAVVLAGCGGGGNHAPPRTPAQVVPSRAPLDRNAWQVRGTLGVAPAALCAGRVRQLVRAGAVSYVVCDTRGRARGQR